MQTLAAPLRIKLHPAQRDFLRSSALFRALVGGIGSGKSWAGAYDMLRRAKPGRLYCVVSPSYGMLSDSTFRSFETLARQLGVADRDDVKKSAPPACRLKTGAEILFRSADDPERLRGPNLSGVWLDEAGLMVKEAFDIAIACLREGGEQGWLTATFTPKGTGHWTYEYFGKDRPNTELVRAHTAENPFNPPEFAATLEEQYGAGSAFALQELGGEFVDDDDGWQVIPTAWVRAAQARWTPTPPAGQGLSCLGVDVAYGGANCTAIVPRYGTWFGRAKKYRGPETDTGQKAAYLVLKEHKDNAPINVDAIGHGSACWEALRDKIGELAV